MQIQRQDTRKVLWVSDHAGNNGKSFLANYLNILYGFLLLDGTMTIRDVALLVGKQTKGICMDVSRDSVREFSYAAVESFKNGYISSGKYSGRTCRFTPFPVVVFANQQPDFEKLSRDRWSVVALGEGNMQNLDKVPIVDPAQQFAFVAPPSPPDLSENFNVREFITERLPKYRRAAAPPVAVILPANPPVAATAAPPPVAPEAAALPVAPISATPAALPVATAVLPAAPVALPVATAALPVAPVALPAAPAALPAAPASPPVVRYHTSQVAGPVVPPSWTASQRGAPVCALHPDSGE